MGTGIAMAHSWDELLARMPQPPMSGDDASLPTLERLRQVAIEHGIDVAMAVAYKAIANHEMHRGFIDEVNQGLRSAYSVMATTDCAVALVPNLGFFIDPKSQLVGDQIAKAARRRGLEFTQIETDPTCDLATNGAKVCQALLAMPFEQIIVMSLSKGSADVKMALDRAEAGQAFARVPAWVNVCGLLDGSPVVNRFLANEIAAEEIVLQWFHRRDPDQVRKILQACRECGRELKSPLSRELDLPRHLQMFNIVAFPTSDTLSYEHTRIFHALMADDGPNDGFGLIADQISTPGVIYPVWGADHYLDRFLDVEALLSTLFAIVVERCGLAAATSPIPAASIAGSDVDLNTTSPQGTVPLSRQKDPTDHERLRHARQRDKGFKVGRYLQPPPMLFTRDGHNVFLGDTYRGGAAFLAGGGPSLASLRLECLQDRGVLSCAMNNAATVFRPNLWVSVDDPGNFADAIWRDPGIQKFVPLCHMEKTFTVRDARGELVESNEAVGDMPAVFGYRRNEEFLPEQWLYEDTFNWGNHSHQVDTLGNKGSRSVMYVALRMLFYLGIRRVFLIGCDFRMEIGKKNYAFEQERTRSSVRGNNSSYEILNRRLGALQPHFEREGFEVWNCTPNSGLTVFPHLSFDEALRLARSSMPQRIDTTGMYDRQRREREQERMQKVADGNLTETAQKAATPSTSRLPPLTLVVAIDDKSIVKLRHTWPTWMRHKPELREVPVLLIHDASIDPTKEDCALFREHPRLRFVPWEMPDALDQRERMLTALAKVPALEVTTPWYLKLDVDVVATGPGAWIDPDWFLPDEQGRLPAFISSPWGYTKPADALARLDDWGDANPRLSSWPRLDLPFEAAAECVAHQRIISWCFFGNTAWTREVVEYAPNRLPCPSQDTYLFYCAARRGDRIIRTRMSRYGWQHVSASLRRLKRECQLALGQSGNHRSEQMAMAK
jgi:hypothetical protein